MHLDWITARLPLELLSPEARSKLRSLGSRYIKIRQATGEVEGEYPCWESLRSECHGLSFQVSGHYLSIAGSPARCEQDGCNVFGGPVTRSLNIYDCLQLMIRWVRPRLGIALPGAAHWQVRRIDVAGNLAFDRPLQVTEALNILKHASSGRHKVDRTYKSSCYWNSKSQLVSATAYAKGAELRSRPKQHPMGKQRSYSESELSFTDRLLRLELRLRWQYCAKIGSWLDVSPNILRGRWEAFFMEKLGTVEVGSTSDVLVRLLKVSPTEGQARAAYSQWVHIHTQGFEGARTMFSKSTWHRNLKRLKEAGLGDADLHAGKVTTLRRNILTYDLVSDWTDLKRAS